MKTTRAEKAGKGMGKSIREMVNLMYQKNTAVKFLQGLSSEISDDLIERGQQRVKDNMAKNKKRRLNEKNTVSKLRKEGS